MFIVRLAWVVTMVTWTGVAAPPRRSSLCKWIEVHEGLGRFPHPSLCTHYLECDTALNIHTRVCPDGLFYDPDKMTCVFPYNIDCPMDECQKQEIRAYANPNDTCGQYFVCKRGWTYERQCCGPGLAFDGFSGCKLDSICDEDCNDNVTSIGNRTGDCFNLPDPDGNNKQFQMLVHNSTVTMSCAEGAMYDVTTCECSILDIAYLFKMGSKVCVPTITLNFMGGKISSFEDKSNYGTYAENRNVSVGFENTPSADGRSASFTGHNQQTILLPRFTFAEFIPKLKINIVFKLNPTTVYDAGTTEALVTNSDIFACPTVRPSISLTVHRVSKSVKAVVHTTLPLEISVTNRNLLLDSWNEVTFIFDGESVSLIVNYFPEKSDPTGNPSRLVAVQCALHIGSGNSLATFDGLIDSFDLYLC